LATTDYLDYGAPLSDVDREALTRALDIAQQESPAQRDQIDTMLRERGWDRASKFAAYCCQDARLRLRPWQTPPCWIRGDPNELLAAARAVGADLGGRQRAALLVKRLLAAGLSRFEPDPETALARKGPN
jgi:hypothetical protein